MALQPTSMTPMQSTLTSLRIQIQNNRIPTIDGHGFVPPASLSTIFTHTALVAAVAELSCDAEDCLGLADAIQQEGLPAFATLVCMSLPDLVVAFRRKRYLNRLPLEPETAKHLVGDLAPTFLRLQWEFIPYHFQRDQDVEIGHEILPFVRDLGPLASGGFGDIRVLELHPSLQNFAPHDSERVVVVRKTIREDPDITDEVRLESFRKEKRSLRLINHPPHSNIVPLLTAYVHGRDYCLLFPRLDMDLKEFLSREEPYGHFEHLSTYILALHGLASALERTHGISIRSDGAEFEGFGYHHDLRPVNVLVSQDTFVLADFGMGRVREREELSTTRFKALAGDYVAPECTNENFAHLDIGRAVDVWAFGCLVCEVLIYASFGVGGLRTFRAARMVSRPLVEITDSLFYDVRGGIKTVVKEWISLLATTPTHPSLGESIRDLVLSILSPVQTRPKIPRVRLGLAHLTLRTYYFAVIDALSDFIQTNDGVPGPGSLMKLWFERERLQAFGSVLSLSTPTIEDAAYNFAGRNLDACVHSLRQLIDTISRKEDKSTDEDETGLSDHPDEHRHPHTAHPFPADESIDRHSSLVSEVERLTQDLWDLLALLPDATVRKAERIWVHSMLKSTNSCDELGNMEASLNARKLVSYQCGAALAMMKKIRLEMLQSPSIREQIGDIEMFSGVIPAVDAKPTYGHQMGTYQGNHRVLIESIFYDASWEKVPSEERTTIMALKAKGFNAGPRPESLRLLNCLGFFETGRDSGRKGFSFVYEVPNGLVSKTGFTTLYRLLLSSARSSKSQPKAREQSDQPILEDKFLLASVLAGFLAEFHSTGWLHENFHPNNVVYFHESPGVEGDEDGASSPGIGHNLSAPFIVGLNKSRPGGEAWHTQGPTDEDRKFGDYRHPAYQNTGRFRVGYDYYSLGIVLLEIGLWTPLAAIAGRSENRTLPPKGLRDVLVSHYVPRLGSKMGRKYQAVVTVLLSDQLDSEPEHESTDADTEDRAFSSFLELVVEPLERLASGIR